MAMCFSILPTKRTRVPEVDMNVVMTGSGGLVETQATAVKGTYTRAQLDEMLNVAEQGIRDLLTAQLECLK